MHAWRDHAGLIRPLVAKLIDQVASDGPSAFRQRAEAVEIDVRIFRATVRITVQSLPGRFRDHCSATGPLATREASGGEKDIIAEIDSGAHTSDNHASSCYGAVACSCT